MKESLGNVEIVPPYAEGLERGDIRTIENELKYCVYKADKLGEYMPHVEEYELKPLQAALDEGYRFVLRLPRDNHYFSVEKYGIHYDKTVTFTQYVVQLAHRNGIRRTRILYDDYFVFETKEDAERLRDAIGLAQRDLKLGFETIDSKVNREVSDSSAEKEE